MLIKVCGMKESGNLGQVAAISGIDLIGLIFYEPSPRYVDSADTALSVAWLTTVKVVGVFVNAAPEEVAAKCKEYCLDYIQLHGIETPQYLISLREQLPEKVKIIKAFPIQNAKDLASVSDYEGLCDYFLFDTKTSGYGGSGEAFDWNILQQYNGFTEFLLSGGIAPDLSLIHI